MSTEALDRARSHKTASPLDRDERARTAVKVFRSLQFSLTGFARALTGNKKVRVDITSQEPHTDGTVIYYCPPIELGDKTPHDRSNCDKRSDDTGILLCPACALRERVMVNILHEIAHIAYGSFAETNDTAKKNALTHAIKEWGGNYAEQLRRKFESAPEFATSTYPGLAQLISPFLPHLVNCLEDARVDSMMFETRKGTRKMLGVDTLSLMRDGLPDADGELHQWKEAPLNSQAALGCYLYAARHEGWEDFFLPEVTELFTDTQLRGLLDGVINCRTVADIYNLAFPVLARLRELGFMLLPEETPEETEDSNEDQEEEEAPSDRDDSSGQDESDDHGDSDQQPSGDGDGSDDRGSNQDGKDSSARHDESGNESDDGGSSKEEGDRPEAESGSGDSDSESEVGSDESASDEVSEGDGEAGEDGEGAAGQSVGSGGSDHREPGGESEGGEGGLEGEPSDTSGSSDSSPKESGGLDDGSDSDGVPEGDAGSSGDHGESSGSSVRSDQERAGSDQPESTTEGGDSDSSGGSDLQAGSESGDGSPDGSEVEGSRPALDGGGESTSGETGGADDLGGSEGEVSAGSWDALTADADGTTDSITEPNSEGDRLEAEASGKGPQLDDILESGADEGLGGIKVEEVSRPEYGDPAIVEQNLAAVHDRQLKEAQGASTPQLKAHAEAAADEQAIAVAILQGLYFETPSTTVNSVRIFKSGDGPGHLPVRGRFNREERRFLGIDYDVTDSVSEKVFGPNLLQLRRIFSDNQTSGLERNRRSGRINKQVLGRRAWNDDDRLFAKRRLPAKKDYAVLIGIDISSSTLGDNLVLAKDAAYIQAELCARLGIKFAVFAHSANVVGDGLSMDIHVVKDWDGSWNPDAIESLSHLAGNGGNLDGHTIEYYRKQLDARTETDRILLYYTDGKMPAANHDEELEILQREIKICKRQNYTLMGVGIRTNSPVKHGLDTVQVDDESDMRAVIDHLGKRLKQ